MLLFTQIITKQTNMKKIICFLSLSLTFASCSGDDSVSETTNPADESAILVKRVVEKYEDGSTETTLFTYEGTKIKTMTNSEGLVTFTYIGDQITKEEFFTVAGMIEQTDTFEYNAEGKLSVFRRLDGAFSYKEVFTYNANNTISVAMFDGNEAAQTTPIGTATITLLNGEVSRILKSNGHEHNYLYDNRNNPTKNVTGFAVISFINGEASGILHNITMDETPSDGDSVFSYEYNDSSFPTKETETFDGEVTVTTYFYE